MNKTNQKGSTAIVILIIVIVLVLVGLAGWYVWNKQHPKKATTSLQTSSSTSNNNQTTQKAATQDQQKFLVIKELGIKLPLSDPIKDLVYTYNTNVGSTNTGSPLLHFSTTSISSIPNSGFTCDTEHDPLGSYSIYTSQQSNDGVTDTQIGTLVTTINGYYIYYKHVQYPCGDSDQDSKKVNSLIQPLLTSVQNAQIN